MSQHARSGVVSVVIECLLGVGVPGIGAAADAHIVNVDRGEIDGVRFSQMTLETIISRLGQPSALEQHKSPHEGSHAKVSYHDVGLSC